MKTKLFALLLTSMFLSCTSNSNTTNETTTGPQAPETTKTASEAKAECAGEVQPRISIEWTDNVDANIDEEKIQRVILNERGVSKFSITTDNQISDLKLLSLEFVEADNNGKIKFNTEEIEKWETFSANERIDVRGDMIDDLAEIYACYIFNKLFSFPGNILASCFVIYLISVVFLGIMTCGNDNSGSASEMAHRK